MTLLKPTPIRKYANRKVTVDAILFDSKKEARRYLQLMLLRRAGKIRALAVHPKYPIEVLGVKICTYSADFAYEEKIVAQGGTVTWLPIVEDVKGARTPVYRLKKKLMRAVHGIDVRET